LTDWLRAALGIPAMLKQIADLTAVVETLKGQVAAAVSNSAALKGALDAALAALAEAQAGALSAEDRAALDAAIAAVQGQAQALADSTAANSPST
jgi:hypothetical protein